MGHSWGLIGALAGCFARWGGGDLCALVLSFCPRGWGLVILGKRENWGEEMTQSPWPSEEHMLFPPAIFILEYTRWTITRR